MRLLCRLAVMGAVLGSSAASVAAQPSEPASSPVLSDIVDMLAHQGRLTPASAAKLRSRILEGKAPTLSADKLPSGAWCATTAMQQAVEWIASQGVPLTLTPPPAGKQLTSSKYPIHVNYNTEDTLAKAALTLMEASWKAQVEDGKFPAPWTGGDGASVTQGMDVYITDLGADYAGMAEPVADVPSTPICDCSSQILVNSNLTAAQLTDVIPHEFNHTLQDATDCTESYPAHESFAVAVSSVQAPSAYLTKAFVPTFQSNPELSLDFVAMNGGPQAMYHFGAALFPLFLAEKYGGGQISFFSNLWRRFEQNGTSSVLGGYATCSGPNQPNWFQGIDDVLKTQGTSFDEAFDEFSVWRSITGSYDDGAHFKDGGKYQAVAIAETQSLDALPVQGTLDLHEYGSRHIELTPGSLTKGLKASVTGDPEASWGGALLLWKGDAPVQVEKLTFTGEKGTASIASLEGVTHLVLVVTQKNFAGHDPDALVFAQTRSFDYTLEDYVPDPGSDPEPDAGTTPPPGATPKGSEDSSSGCGCRTADRVPLGFAPFALFAAALAALRLRVRPTRRR